MQNMKNKKLNDGPVCKKQSGSLAPDGSRGIIDPLQIWTQMEDLVVPRLRLSLADRAVYSYLLRRRLVEGKPRLHFAILWLARGICVSTGTARDAVRRLVNKGALWLVERTRAGHVVEVRLPEQILAALPDQNAADGKKAADAASGVHAEETDFLKSKELRMAIHAREGGICFYCGRGTTTATRCLDHVVPVVRRGSNSQCNLVSACVDCNSQKGEMKAEDFLVQLHRQRRLSSSQLGGRLRALEALAAGELQPRLPDHPQKDSQTTTKLAGGNLLSRRPHPAFHPENLGAFARPRKHL
jgi:hypothetical protein